MAEKPRCGHYLGDLRVADGFENALGFLEGDHKGDVTPTKLLRVDGT